MRVIVTRPCQSGRRTAEKLRQRGHDPVILPLTAPTHDVLAAARALKQPYSAIAVTSAEAIRALEKLEEGLELHRDALLFGVGRVTAAAAQAAGFTRAQAAEGTGLDLADRILAHFRETGPPQEPLLYLAGRPRSPALERTLSAAGLPYRTVECYHMLPIEHAPERLHRLLVETPAEAVLFYSRENVDRFFSLSPFMDGFAALAQTRFYCLSRNIAAAVPAAMSERVRIAPSPDEEALLDLL